MRKYCKNLYKQLRELGNLHSEFTMDYQECEAARDFSPMKKLKDDFKQGIADLIKKLPPLIGLKRAVRNLKCDPDPEENEKMKEKLLELISRDSYDKAVAVAQELDPKVVLPKRETIIKSLLALGPERLKNIAQIMKEPGLITVPRKSLKELKKAMDANPHNEGKKNKVYELPGNHKWSHGTKKTNVCIVDMTPLPEFPPIEGIEDQSDVDKLNSYERYYGEKGLDMVTDRQYAVAMQLSLHRCEAARIAEEGDEVKYILNVFGNTLFRNEINLRNKNIGEGGYNRGIYFELGNPIFGSKNHHSRASITLIE